MKKNLLKKFYACLPSGMSFIVTTMMFSVCANAQNVNIPDTVFKSKLVNNININTNGDGEIQVSEAANFNGELNVSRVLWTPPGGGPPIVVGPVITDLTGIEAFVVLTGLNCSRNSLTGLNLSANITLTMLDCSYNQLTSLDVSANTALDSLFCLDNQLTSLDVSANTALNVLNCGNNQLTSLDVSANTALTWLYCSLNPLTMGLNVSTNTALTMLFCAHNQLTSLDVSANTALTVLACGTNLFASINVQNGNNSNFTYFDAINNPNLTCIQVDNVAYSNANWTFKDAIASYSTNCGISSVSDVDNSTVWQLFPNPANNHLTINLGSNNIKVEVTIADITGKVIYTTKATETPIIEVNTDDFKAGTYLVQILTSDFIATKKLVVEK